jgi:DNA-directed RNA polymerase specialized sigma24 family protein
MEMSAPATCCCPLCELEYALLSELNDSTSETKYQTFASLSPILSAFPTGNDLLSQLRQRQGSDNHAPESDNILGELLRISRTPLHGIGRHLLLLILMPAIHKTSSQIAFGFPSLARDDIAQHLLTCLLDIVSSQALCAQTSHFAFAITRAMRRSAFRWAIRESDLSVPASLQENTLNELSTDPNSSFEPKLLLSDFLSRCLSSGLLTPPEYELLLLFKIQGVSSEVLAARQHVSEVAFRHRMQRVIEKLRRVARARPASSQPPEAAVA